MLAFAATVALLFTASWPDGQAQDTADDQLPARIDPYVEKQRVLVMTDIANEPDDQMSLVRFLVYSPRTAKCARSSSSTSPAFRRPIR